MEFTFCTYRTLVQPDSKGHGEVLPLSPCDQTAAFVATSRASFWPSTRFDVATLEEALKETVTDLPFLAGRIAPLGWTPFWSLSDLAVALTGDGAELAVVAAPRAPLAALGPDSWVMRGVTLDAPAVGPHIPRLDVAARLLGGREPLLKVQLTRCADGDVLALTALHALTDGLRWPALLAHLAARYREAAGGGAPPAGALLPRDGGKRALTAAALAAAAAGSPPPPPPPRAAAAALQPSLGDYWRAARFVAAAPRGRRDLVMLHVPRARLAALKAAVAAAPGGGGGDAAGAAAVTTTTTTTTTTTAAVTTGDVVQALAALALAAAGAPPGAPPPLPVAPRCMLALVQLPLPPETIYFGNAVHPLPVSLAPAAAAALRGDDWAGRLAALARAVRAATAAFRGAPAAGAAALAEVEALAALPVHASLALLAGRRLPAVQCSTNFIPALRADAELDFGLYAEGGGGGGGAPRRGPAATQWLVAPLASDMAIIRPAMPPYGEGLFVAMALPCADAARLRGHPLLATLAPDAVWVGDTREGPPPVQQ